MQQKETDQLREIERLRAELAESRALVEKLRSGHQEAEQRLLRYNALQETIVRAQAQFITNVDTRVLFDELLGSLLSLTKSEYGFIGEVFRNPDGSPYLKTHAITNIAWDDETRAFYEKHETAGLEFRNLESLFGAVMTTGREVISNCPSTDPRRCGLPRGHPPLEGFLGLPFYSGGRMVGMIGIANRPGGYDRDLVEFLQPFTSTCANIIAAHNIDRRRRKAESALHQSREKYRALFEGSKDVIFMTTPEGRVLDTNPAGVELSGFSSREEVISTNVRDFYQGHEERERFKREMAERGFVKDFELTFRKKDGETGRGLVTSSAVRDEQGRITAYWSIMRDVTEQKRLQEQLLHAQKKEAIGELTGGIAHDFNNITTTIKAFSGLALKKAPETGQLREYLLRIRAATDRAANLTRQLLILSSKLPTELKVFDLNDLASDLLQVLGSVIGERITIKTHFAEDLWSVKADKGSIDQVLMNLVVNARDAMPTGGELTIRTENHYIEDRGGGEAGPGPGRYVCLTVRDTGEGMEEDVAGRIFEPFYTTKGIGQGTGLGLAVVDSIVKSYGGVVDVSSRPGRGSAFRVCLPASHEAVKKAPREERAEEPPGAGERVLLVEDEKQLLESLALALKMNGYRVSKAESAEKALEIFDREGGTFDLVVSDTVLPDKSGIELAAELRKKKPGLRVILTSGYMDIDTQWPEIKREGHHFLQKPYEPTDLLKAINECMR